ncbi:MAG: ferritin family protein [Deltaproteobacteria bacterium]|nr:ferritin family protein [Deltaproteobacteria bacterium]
MAQDKLIQDLNTAYNTEITGYHFYTTAAALVEDSKGRAVFSNLAKDELAHIVVIGKIAESIKNGLGWISYEEALAQGFGIALSGQIPFPAENELLKRLSTNQSDTNAVQIAIETEMAAVDFYSNLLKTADTPVEKVCVTKLLEMEKGHLKVLRWEYESLNKTGFWCGEMEFSVEKESE